MSLGEKQRKFTRMIGQLIEWAYLNGYELTFGDAWAKTGHMKNSLHYIRLAIDLNLFKDGEYLTATEDYTTIGEQWETMGGTWGGRFQDGNHFSIEHEGRR